MAILELVDTRPNWLAALDVALRRPSGVPERRANDDPWRPNRFGRPRRISDDLAWFRSAMDEPDEFGLRPLAEPSAITAWEPDPEADLTGRLRRLRDRGILDAAGFLLHESDQSAVEA